MRSRGRAAVGVAAVVVALALLVGGCGDGDGDRSSSKTAADEGRAGSGASKAAESETGAADVATADAQTEPRDIVFTADAVVRVGDVETASGKAASFAEAAGGHVSGQVAELEGDPTSTVTVRVPASRFRPVLDQLTGLGTVDQRSIDSNDVTDEVVDLTGRLETLRASADRLRDLIAEAPGTGDVIAIEKELATREADIESLAGRLRLLDDQADLATITVRFIEKAESAKVDDDLPGFFQALKAGAVTLANIGLVALAVIGFLLPYLPFAAIAWLLVRRHRRRHPRPAAPPAAGWPPPGYGPGPGPGWSAPQPPDQPWTAGPSAPPGDGPGRPDPDDEPVPVG
jgi:hypothetical protein